MEIKPDGQVPRQANYCEEPPYPSSQTKTCDAAQRGENREFGQELPNDTTAARAQSQADCQLSSPPGDTREQQVGDIHHGHQQDQLDQGYHRRRAESIRPGVVFFRSREPFGHNLETDASIVGRMLTPEPFRDYVHRRLRVFDADPLPHSSECVQVTGAAIVQRGSGRPIHRQIKLSFGESKGSPEVLGNHANDRARLAIEGHLLSDDGLVSTEST